MKLQQRICILAALLLSPFLVYVVGANLLMLFPNPMYYPPGWEESHLKFDSDEEMVAYCNCLAFDTSGLDVKQVDRALEFEPGGETDQQKWVCLNAEYQFYVESRKLSKIYLKVYFCQLEATESFPNKNKGMYLQMRNIRGIPVQYQRFQDIPCMYDVLFQYGGYTYQVRIDLDDDSEEDTLKEYLTRIIPS